jgi:hypothetical protein
VGHNFAVGWIRRRLLHEQRLTGEVPSDLPDPRHFIEPARDVVSRGLLDTILECIARMDTTCRTLLLGSAYELRPRELTGLLGWPKDQNQRAADHLYECRRRLVKLLRQQGIDPTYVESVRQSL